MKKSSSRLIITKKTKDMMWRFRIPAALTLLLVLTIFIRTYRLGERLEFLGDQGSTAVILRHAIQTHSVPLVGPEVSIGLRPGPMFYYLILPFYWASGFNPYAMVLPMIILSVLTVIILWQILHKLTNWWVATGIAIIYACSPIATRQEIAIWNPSSIPFFIALLIYSLVKVIIDKDERYYALTGLSLGCAVQLHYTNAINIIFVWLVSLIMLFRAKHQKKAIKTWKWQLLGIGCFLLVLSPYLYYQWIHGFEDIRSLILLALLPAPMTAVSSNYYHGFWLGIELIRNVIPIKPNIGIIGISLALIFGSWLLGKKWSKFFVLWFVFSMAPIVLYHGALFEHYVYFLGILPFVIFGTFLYQLTPKRYKYIALVFCMMLAVWQGIYWKYIHVSPTLYYNDIERTKMVTRRMIELGSRHDFSFTLLTYRSFSDYHYRFFFEDNGVYPRFIYDEDYPILFLVCDNAPCPRADEVRNKSIVKVLCYEHHCKPFYPDKRLTGFGMTHWEDIQDARIYLFEKQN